MKTLIYNIMNNKLKELEIKRLLKELEYVESDFEYRNEIISEADHDFIGKVNIFLEGHPELKELYDRRITETLNNNFIKKAEEINKIKESEEVNEVVESDAYIIEKSPKLKKAYRDIVKVTHPDKVVKESLNNLYMKATNYYDNNDTIGLLKICYELSINFEIDEEENALIRDRINDIKNKINFLESTITWKWLESDDSEKNELMFNFIKMRIN